MKTLFWYFTILCGIVMLPSCRFVNPSTTVEGTITNAVTGKPIEGEEIYIDENGLVATGRGDFKSCTSNAEGKFEFKFKASEMRAYTCNIRNSTHYLSISGSSMNQVLEKAANNIITYNVAPSAYLRHPVNNAHYVNEQDEMGYRCYHLELGIQRFGQPNDGYAVFYGDYHAAGAYYNEPSEVPMGTYAFDWYVIRNGVKNTFVDTLYLAAGQDTLYEINY